MSPAVLPDRRARQPDLHEDAMSAGWRSSVRSLT